MKKGVSKMTEQEYKCRENYYNGYKLAVRDYDLFGSECCLGVIDIFDKEEVSFERGYVDGYNYMRGEQNP